MSHINAFITKCHSILLEKNSVSYEYQKYLMEQRHLTIDTIKRHLIGVCPKDMKIPEEIKHYGEKDEEQQKKDYSRTIQGRIIVPIHDEFGCIISFSTRSIYDDGTTWWNMPFCKGNNLFLLGKSKKNIFEQNKVYLVEGYMDAIVLQQSGILNAVSVMGTNITLRQVGLLVRYCNNLCLCFDVDSNMSGQKAQKKSIVLMDRFKIFDEISVINGLPEGEDPDDFVFKNGKDKFLAMEKILDEREIKKIYKETSKNE